MTPITLHTIKLHALKGNVYADEPSYHNHRIRVIRHGNRFQLSNGVHLTIEPGFEWDEASVPYILQWAYPKSGKYAYSALIHDALYYNRYGTRKFCDDEFYKWMLATIPSKQAYMRWLFVRAFGWVYWRKKPSIRAINNKFRTSFH